LHAEGGPSAGRAALWLLGLAALLLSLGANRASQMAVAMAPAAVVAFLVAWASLTALAARRARLCVGVALVVLVALWTAVALVVHGQEAHARWQPHGAEAPMRIPRQIHLMLRLQPTHLTRNLSARPELCPEACLEAWHTSAATAWRQHHPSWRCKIWSGAEVRDLISRDLPWLLVTYDGYPHEAQRAAAAAYAVLYLHGGVHASLTMRPLADVSTLLRGHELVLARTPDFGLSNGLLAAPAGHPFLEELLMELPQHARRSWLSVFPEHSRLLASAGSTYLWAKFMHWSQTWPRMPIAVLLPANYGKPSLCDQSNAGSQWLLSSDASAREDA
jgi:hypothetical protein